MKRRLALVMIALGLYLTLRGYHSRDGDQAYRLPLLLAQQDPSLYRFDPFVRAFDVFNPHRCYLALLDATSRIIGLSAALAFWFAVTFVVTGLAIDQLARAAWPRSSASVGLWAVALVLIAKAGNLGTNHLFEAMLLDRLMAMALGWLAIAAFVVAPISGTGIAAVTIGLAALLHPSLGLQLGALLIAGQAALVLRKYGTWWLAPVSVWRRSERVAGVEPRSGDTPGAPRSRGAPPPGASPFGLDLRHPKSEAENNRGRIRCAIGGAALITLGLLPTLALMGNQSQHLLEGLPAADFLMLSASIQSPQHMLPHLWRTPQWLAGAGYIVLAVLSLIQGRRSACRERLVMILAIAICGLVGGWFAVEILHSVKLTVFQPFRMATVARGLCLVLIADRVRALWGEVTAAGRIRALLIASGLSGDWLFVVVTLIEVAATIGGRWNSRLQSAVVALASVVGFVFLSKHDTESGHIVLTLALVAGLLFQQSLVARFVSRCRSVAWNRKRALGLAFIVAWLIPVSAMILPSFSNGTLACRLAAHCRFGEWADGDVERLAVWCRKNTPPEARFIGPPGPKTFRLWSRREVAFNRAASPYHAAGLADWFARFRDHVGFRGSISEFAAMYLKDRQMLEHGFDRMTDYQLAKLAQREGADYVLASSKLAIEPDGAALEPLRVAGRFAVYRARRMSRAVAGGEAQYRDSHPVGGNRKVLDEFADLAADP